MPQKYYLSRKACLGIINRCKKRGKELPAELEEILAKQGGGRAYENHSADCRFKRLDKISNTIGANLGEGGNNQPLVINDYGGYRMCMTKDKTNTLRAKSDPAPCTLQVRSGCEGGGKGALVAKDMSATLNTGNTQYLIDKIVRKLTPTECARLQGFPD